MILVVTADYFNDDVHKMYLKPRSSLALSCFFGNSARAGSWFHKWPE